MNGVTTSKLSRLSKGKFLYKGNLSHCGLIKLVTYPNAPGRYE